MASVMPRNLGNLRDDLKAAGISTKDTDDLLEQVRLLLSPEELQQQAAADFRTARAFLLNLFPFLGRALGSVTPVQAPGLGTMAVDKYWRLYYDPVLWDRCSRVEIAAMIMHEVEHLLGRHAQRAAAILGYEPPPPSEQSPTLKRLLKKMNIAMDYAIHGRKGWTRDNVPRWGVFPDKDGLPLGLSFEKYLSLMPDDEEEEEDGGDGGRGRKGESCGGGSGAGQPNEWELGDPGEAGSGLGKDQQEQVLQGTAQDIKEAQESGRLQGKDAGRWVKWADQFLAPSTVPWQTLAAAVIRQQKRVAGADDFSWQRPSPLSWGMPDGIILPGMVSYEFTTGVVLDQSGSMGDKDVMDSMSEVEGLIKTCNSKVNAYVAAVDVASAHKDLHSMRSLTGGRTNGGTDLRPAMAQAIKDNCDLLVVCTDGYTPWPSERPRVPVVVLLFGAHCGEKRCPDWATVVVCD